MKIDERLNLVLPLYREADPYAWVHSVPISREMFEAHYKLLNRAFTALMNEGQFSGRVAHLLFRDVAKDLGGGVAEGERLAAPVLNEIRRLSNIALATAKGWETLPLDDALSRHLIDADDVAEVMSALVFFTVGWHLSPKAMRSDFLNGGVRMWGAQTSSLDSTAYFASLGTSTATESSGGMAHAPQPIRQPDTMATITDPYGRVSTSSLPV